MFISFLLLLSLLLFSCRLGGGDRRLGGGARRLGRLDGSRCISADPDGDQTRPGGCAERCDVVQRQVGRKLARALTSAL